MRLGSEERILNKTGELKSMSAPMTSTHKDLEFFKLLAPEEKATIHDTIAEVKEIQRLRKEKEESDFSVKDYQVAQDGTF